MDRDSNRPRLQPPLDYVQLCVEVSIRSLCHMGYLTDGEAPDWLVYTGVGRGCNVKLATPLLADTASFFCKLPRPYARKLEALKFARQISRFVSKDGDV